MKRSAFVSKFGTIATVGGSVIGLGNIWRFPYLAGSNGGAAFIMIYVLASLFIAVPLMITEFSIGRATKRNSMRAFGKIAGNKKWGAIGLLGISSATVILSFYNVIAGWALDHLLKSVRGVFMTQTSEQIVQNFDLFVNTGWQSVVYTLIFSVATGVIVSMGVEKGIERYNKVLMPIMFVILVGMAVNSLFMPGFHDAIKFLFTPDFSKINTKICLEAIGQSFFSMSIGLGAMVTYGSYIAPKENLFKVAGSVAGSDLCVAILSGLAIFPAVFSFGINPTSGPELVFLTLPNIFSQMPGGYFVSIIFFFLLCGAAITSTISLVEVITAFVTEEFRIKRNRATLIVVVIISILSSMCAISQKSGSALKIGNMNLFDVFDSLSSNYMLPIGGMVTAIFAGWIINKARLKKEMTNDGKYSAGIQPIALFLVKFITPIAITILFLTKSGLLKF